jgi:hypothetical protein
MVLIPGAACAEIHKVRCDNGLAVVQSSSAADKAVRAGKHPVATLNEELSREMYPATVAMVNHTTRV